MDSDKFIGDWILTSAPFKCRAYILNNINIHFYENGLVSACDSINSTGTSYTVMVSENKENQFTGIITIESSEWTMKGRVWRITEEGNEAKTADNFIHDLMKSSFSFELKGDIMTIKYQEGQYEFTRDKH